MTFGEFINIILQHGLEKLGRYYSNYRAFVVDNEDPDGLNRIKVNIPSLTRRKVHTKWVYPKSVFSGQGYGSQVLPKVGDLVWVEFEYGDTEFPLWSHAHYSKGEKPTEFVNSKVYGFKTPSGQLVIIDDRPDEVYVKIKDATDNDKTYTTELIAFNHGENGGLVKVVNLTKELHKLQNKLNDFMSRYDTHTHIDPISGYTGVPSPVLGASDIITPRPEDIELTDQSYIENEKVLH